MGTDQPDDRPIAKGSRYWLPGLSGILLESALIELVTLDKPMELIISKHRLPDGSYHFGVTLLDR
ncbi:MAG TPA: hypothetical protein PKI24_18200 [Nitrospira sp.]|uniref:hypothetical protein n=1 Tax=Accumulibacter sp. TaxID=2053492 RepID=UPI0025F6B13C|nr:hypothetical protein [Accumulibacter sp.]MCM8598893.1 hypothetical protein [Accumulibacter sp.]HNP41538.1 hypothetical protein [Nitrospira sp.]